MMIGEQMYTVQLLSTNNTKYNSIVSSIAVIWYIVAKFATEFTQVASYRLPEYQLYPSYITSFYYSIKVQNRHFGSSSLIQTRT